MNKRSPFSINEASSFKGARFFVQIRKNKKKIWLIYLVLDVNQAMAGRVLKTLVEKRMIRKYGNGKNTYYEKV